MKFSKLSLAMASVLGAGISADAFAIDLYVDTKTQQLFAQPGLGRVKLGTFEKVEDQAAAKAQEEESRAIQDKIIDEKIDDKIARHQQAIEDTPGMAKVKVDKKGLTAETYDKNFKFNIGGRLHADATWQNGDDYYKRGTTDHVEANDGTEIRRARIDFSATMFKDWGFKTVVDYSDNEVHMKDLFLSYKGFKWAKLLVGQQKQSFSHEVWMSSNDMMFTERSSMSALTFPVIDRAIGLGFESGGVAEGMGWSLAGGAFGDTITPNIEKNLADEGWGIALRGTFNPILRKDKLIHLGLGGAYREPDDNNTVLNSDKFLEFSYKTTHMSNLKLVDLKFDPAKLGATVDHVALMGAELGGMYGPFSVMGEYTRAWVQLNEPLGSSAAADPSFDGWYVQAGYTLTGESRTYDVKNGKFKRLKPAQNFSLTNGGWGAWEVAARYGAVDLNDSGYFGGSQSDVTVALNWYVNENVRFMADWMYFTNLNNSPVTKTNGDEPDGLSAFTLRSQWAF
ncbi:MAG: OprO/OprP family phosphate-selective porin [Gammaproteobacteria bacterium]